jgi:acyl-CoA thioester hydrolase
MMGGWIDLNTRKLRALPSELFDNLKKLDHTDDFYTITKEHTRKHGEVPMNLTSV